MICKYGMYSRDTCNYNNEWMIFFDQLNAFAEEGGGGGRKVPALISTFENFLDI